MSSAPPMGLFSPSRKVLANSQHMYPFGGTPATDVLGPLGFTSLTAKVLLLACEDPRHLVASMGAHARLNLRNLHAAMHSRSALLLARTALILLLCVELEPKPQDMAFLWDVWFNALWAPGTWERLKPYIVRLKEGR